MLRIAVCDDDSAAVQSHSKAAEECLKQCGAIGEIVAYTHSDNLLYDITEDNISGRLSDERFSKLSRSYEDEQCTLSEKVRQLHAELDKEQTQAVNVAQFIALVKKHSEIDALTPAIVNEFIERINVHAPDKSSGHRTQQINIVYNFVGMLPVSLAKKEAA